MERGTSDSDLVDINTCPHLQARNKLVANHLLFHLLRACPLSNPLHQSIPATSSGQLRRPLSHCKRLWRRCLAVHRSQEYLMTSNRRNLSQNRWLKVLPTSRGLVECINVNRHPGWMTGPNDNGILLMLLSTSEIARRWSSGNGFLCATNETMSGRLKLAKNW